jgi:hypothetical protein
MSGVVRDSREFKESNTTDDGVAQLTLHLANTGALGVELHPEVPSINFSRAAASKYSRAIAPSKRRLVWRGFAA